MIGALPKKLKVNGVDYEIRSDFRQCLLILNAFNDEEIMEYDRNYLVLKMMYRDFESIPEDAHQEAMDKAIWFLNCGDVSADTPKNKKPLYDWEQDEQMIFSSINKVAGYEVRACDYLHFWTFIGFFNEIGEGMFQTIVGIRNKKNKGKKLEKYEKEFYNEHKHIIDLKKKQSIKDQMQMAELDKILGL